MALSRIQTAEIADNAITTSKVADATVIATDIVDGTIVDSMVASGAAIAHTKCDLGTVAGLDVGTGANQILQLNGSGTLPVLDGTALTGIVTDFTPLENQMTRLALHIGAVEQIDKDKERLILGGQGNLWTEYISTNEKAEYMALPRMSAMAEVLWSPRHLLNFRSFNKRMKWNYLRLDRMNANYRKVK